VSDDFLEFSQAPVRATSRPAPTPSPSPRSARSAPTGREPGPERRQGVLDPRLDLLHRRRPGDPRQRLRPEVEPLQAVPVGHRAPGRHAPGARPEAQPLVQLIGREAIATVELVDGWPKIVTLSARPQERPKPHRARVARGRARARAKAQQQQPVAAGSVGARRRPPLLADALDAPETVIAAALEQIEQGFAVFALKADAKVPVTEHGFKNATTRPTGSASSSRPGGRQLRPDVAGRRARCASSCSTSTTGGAPTARGRTACSTSSRRTARCRRRRSPRRRPAAATPSTAGPTTSRCRRRRAVRLHRPLARPRLPRRPGIPIGDASTSPGPAEIAELPTAWVEAAIAETTGARGPPRRRRRSPSAAGFALPERIPSRPPVRDRPRLRGEPVQRRARARRAVGARPDAGRAAVRRQAKTEPSSAPTSTASRRSSSSASARRRARRAHAARGRGRRDRGELDRRRRPPRARHPELQWIVPTCSRRAPRSSRARRSSARAASSTRSRSRSRWAASCSAARSTQGDVLYLALEDGKRRGQTRLRAALGDRSHAPRPPRGPLVRGAKLGEGLEAGARRLARGAPDARLVAIDTLQRVRAKGDAGATPTRSTSRTSPGCRTSSRTAPSACSSSTTARRTPATTSSRVSGTYGITGSADTTLVIQRKRLETFGKLVVTGRDVEEVEEPVQFNGMTWSQAPRRSPRRASSRPRSTRSSRPRARSSRRRSPSGSDRPGRPSSTSSTRWSTAARSSGPRAATSSRRSIDEQGRDSARGRNGRLSLPPLSLPMRPRARVRGCPRYLRYL
jgi:hypothetical protein